MTKVTPLVPSLLHEVLQKLRSNGTRRIVMLTGDHPETAEVVADGLGIASAIFHTP
jgi:cation transport ATPase